MDELVTEMEHLGYPVTKRRLIDWAQKGLLPHPRPRGRGRGRGKTYQWSEPDILRRAVDIADLLAWHRRAPELHLSLWLLGHDVPLSRVREGLRRFADGLDAGVEAAVPVGGDRSDLVSDLVNAAEAQLRRQPHALPTPLVAAVLHAVLASGTKHWAWIGEDLESALSSGEAELPGWPDAGGTLAVVAALGEHLSVPRIREAVATASDAELVQVHADLRRVAQSARAIAAVALDVDEGVVVRLLVHLGLWGALIDLALRRAGRGAMIERLVERFVDTGRHILADPRMRAEIERLRAGGGRNGGGDNEERVAASDEH